ncbi:7alpha-cephem-methoxylase P8 chain protein [Rutstroemia sp. NJR-2017a BVV2]|nr:7alpha-cephem-methoxylase P8 chain protein [Rutstroemia sp. NJR-2017a BVV2]
MVKEKNRKLQPSLTHYTRVYKSLHLTRQKMQGTVAAPYGDVTAPLSFYGPPADNSEPYFIVSRDIGKEANFNFSDSIIDVPIHDVRSCKNEFTLDNDAFQVIKDAPQANTLHFTDDEAIKENYYSEVRQLLSKYIPGNIRIFVYDHTVRRESKGAEHRPLTRVHVDHTANNVIRRIRQYFPTEADSLLQERYRIVNVWRPLNKQPLESYPLAFASASTFEDHDVIPVEHRHEDGSLVREVGLVKYNSSQDSDITLELGKMLKGDIALRFAA